MSLPRPVSAYLESLFAERSYPFTIQLDQQYRLLNHWGDGEASGFRNPGQGIDMRDYAPFLHDLDLASADVLPNISAASGQIFHLHVLPDGDHSYIVFMPPGDEFHKRFEYQQTANEVRLLNSRQQRLLSQLAEAKDEIEAREREAARANQVKSRFIAGMSHEFRTPLTSVLGYAELILEQARADEELTAHAEAIGRAARHLLSMVDNVLDQARLENGSVVLHIAPVNVRQVMDDLAAIIAPLAAEKLLGFAAYVDTAVPEFVNTDVVRLRQILLNILGNAVKYTDQGNVGVDVKWRDGVLFAEVIDTGPGIPAGEVRAIFDEFTRGSSSGGTRGTGLGLNITKKLLTVLNGDIDVHSVPGQGSRFRMQIPAPVSSERPRTKEDARHRIGRPAVDPTDCSILLAEDDADIVQLLQIILGREGYRVVHAPDGQQAVEKALSESPDLVLMDVNMPGLDGLSATRALREQGFERPIIALTASLGVQDRDSAYESGCTSYLAKPISTAELLSAIDRHLATA